MASARVSRDQRGTEAPPRAVLPGWLGSANALIKGLNRIGLRLGTIHVLTITGRKSGEPRSTPVSLLTVDGRRYVIAGLDRSAWAKNARAAGQGELSQGRRREQVQLAEVVDPSLRRRVMSAFPTEVPHGVQFFIRIGLVTSADPAEFAAASDRVAVFEVLTCPRQGEVGLNRRKPAFSPRAPSTFAWPLACWRASERGPTSRPMPNWPPSRCSSAARSTDQADLRHYAP